MTVAFTQGQYDALKNALAMGVLTTEYQGKKTTYRSKAEIESILRRMERELGLASATDGFVPVEYSKGLGPITREPWS